MREADGSEDGPPLTEFLDRFDLAWQAGQAPPINAFLPAVGSADDTAREARRRALVELIKVDLEYRWRCAVTAPSKLGGSRPTLDHVRASEAAVALPNWPQLEDYQACYPELGRLTTLPLELIAEEYRVRHRFGDRPGYDEFQRRFPGREPQLTEALQRVDSERVGMDTGAEGTTVPPQRVQHAQPTALRVRCPHCRNPIEVVDIDAQHDTTCPSCGSSFSLIPGESTATMAKSTVRRLGQFELVEQLGVGAFGSVWKARDTELDRVVAVKVPRKEQLAPDEVEQFFREARAAARLRHPHIVTVYEVGREGNTVYIVSELIRGVTLADWLSGQNATPREAAKLGATVAEALHHAHMQGVIHRDLKPGNIMLDAEGQPHIMDFGLAKREAGEITMTVEGSILGTPAYMSPEQARGEGHKVDGRTDVYSLGVILFQMLTAELPFRGTPRMLLHQVLNDEPRTPRSLNDRVPRDLETICMKAMAKDASRRYATAAEMAADLRRYLAGETILARPVGRVEKSWRWCRRNPILAGMSAAVFALLVAVAATSSVAALRIAAAGRETARQRDSAQAALGREEEQRELAEKQRAAALAAAQGEAEQRQRAEEQKQAAEEQSKLAEQRRIEAERRQLEAERAEYVADIVAAQQAFQQGNVEEVLEILQQLEPKPGQPDFRGFEYHYLWRACNEGHRTLRGHLYVITDVAVSPDGKTLVTCAADTTVRAWNVETRQQSLVAQNEKISYLDAEFSPDGKLLAIAGNNNILIFEAGTWKPLRTLEGHRAQVAQVAFFPDSARLVSIGLDQRLRVWDATSGKTADGFATGGYPLPAPGWSVAVSRDGKTIAAGTGQQLGVGGANLVRLFDVEARKFVANLQGHTAAVYSLAFSPDGTRLASAAGDWSVRLWDLANHSELRTLRGHTGSVNSVAFAPDGQSLVSASGDRTVVRWNTESGASLATLRGHTRSVGAARFLPDGRTIVSASSDATIKLWPLDQKDFVRLDPHQSAATPSTAATGSIFSASKQADQTEMVMSMDFTPDARRLVVATSLSRGAGNVAVWDLAGGKILSTFKGRPATVGMVSALSNDGKLLATAEGYSIPYTTGSNLNVGKKARLMLRHLDTGEVIREWEAETDIVMSLTFSPDGSLLAGAHSQGRVAVWQVPSGATAASMKVSEALITAVAFSPDGQTAAVAGDDKLARLFDAQTWKQTAELPHKEMLFSLAFSPDGLLLATGGATALDQKYLAGGTVTVWDVKTRTIKSQMTGHTQLVRWLHFASGNTGRLVSVSGDGTARLWDTEAGYELLALRGPRSASAGAVSEDGNTIAVGYEDGSVQLWSSEAGADAQIAWHERIVANCFAKQEWTRAIEHLDKLIALRPDDTSLLFSKIRAYWELGDAANLIAVGQRARQSVDPSQLATGFGSWVGSMYLEASVHQQNKDYVRLARAFQVIADLYRGAGQLENPKGADILLKLGNSYLVGHEESKAIDAFRQALAIQRKLKGADCPDATDNLFQLGAKCYLRADYDAATRVLEEVAAAREEIFGDSYQFVNALDILAFLRRDKGQLADARRLLERELLILGRLNADAAAQRRIGRELLEVLRQIGDQKAAEDLLASAAWNKPSGEPPQPLGAADSPEPALADMTQGLQAEFFGDVSLNKRVTSRTDNQIDFFWNGSVPHPGVPRTKFSARWRGWLKAPRSGQYRISVVAKGGTRMWVDGKLKIDQWHEFRLERHDVTVDLTEEPAFVELDFFNGAGGAALILRWTPPESNELAPIPSGCWHSSLAAANAAPPGSTSIAAADTTQHGLKAALFRGTNFEHPVTTRVDSIVDFFWDHQPPASGMPADCFSIRWTGKLLVPSDGKYSFKISSDDGCRLWIDDRPIADVWELGNRTAGTTSPLELKAGLHDLKVEYCDYFGAAWITLRWSREEGFAEEVIPNSALLPDAP